MRAGTGAVRAHADRGDRDDAGRAACAARAGGRARAGRRRRGGRVRRGLDDRVVLRMVREREHQRARDEQHGHDDVLAFHRVAPCDAADFSGAADEGAIRPAGSRRRPGAEAGTLGGGEDAATGARPAATIDSGNAGTAAGGGAIATGVAIPAAPGVRSRLRRKGKRRGRAMNRHRDDGQGGRCRVRRYRGDRDERRRRCCMRGRRDG